MEIILPVINRAKDITTRLLMFAWSLGQMYCSIWRMICLFDVPVSFNFWPLLAPWPLLWKYLLGMRLARCWYGCELGCSCCLWWWHSWYLAWIWPCLKMGLIPSARRAHAGVHIRSRVVADLSQQWVTPKPIKAEVGVWVQYSRLKCKQRRLSSQQEIWIQEHEEWQTDRQAR